jgi:epoxyqueuosine reductase
VIAPLPLLVEPRAAKSRITAHARHLGFDLVGVAPAAPFLREQTIFKQRRDGGYLGQWRYDDARIEQNCDPAKTLAGAQSIICTATSYLCDAEPHDPSAPGLRGAVSSHAWGDDYHRTIGKRLRRLAEFVSSEFPGTNCVPCVDTGPLVDRAAAVRAGIGWFGKSGNVLTKEFGSYVLLGELITTLPLEPDEPLRTNCGTCTECQCSCPTGAILENGAVDSRRCISDLTQSKRAIPRELRKAMGNRLWGCDSCQTSCPVNWQKSSAGAPAFRPRPEIGTSVDLPAVLRMTKSEFRRWFGPTSMAWRGKAVLQRNAAVALGNSRDERAIPHLIAALRDRKPLVRGHAAWALGELGGPESAGALAALLVAEPDPSVRDEIESALAKTTS